MKTIWVTAIAAIALCTTAFAPRQAAALPIAALADAPQVAAGVETAAWVCGPFRCWWRPNYYGAYGWGGPRFYARPWWRNRDYTYSYRRSWWGGPRW